jgi:DNA-binding winged helix-turn-helix (wHTH) protein/dipeptidyl aminopeptidase/acylaminoacyl peptidase
VPHTSRIRFAEFEADLKSQELFRNGSLVRLPNQSFQALAALLERPGELVTREELRGRLWPDNRVVEFEQGLNAIINRLREALGDSADSPRFIETLPRRGYRFIGTSSAAPGSAPTEAPHSPRVPLSREVRLAAAAVIALVALGITWAALRWLPHDVTDGTLPRRSVAAASTGAATLTPLTTLVGEEHMPALSPDGTRVLFAWESESGAGVDLYVRPLDSERLTRLTRKPAQAAAGSWSPDGTRIAVTRMDDDGGLFLIDATGGAERRLVTAAFTQESLMQPSWSPDGSALAFSVVNSAGSHEIRVLDLGSSSVDPLPRAPPCWHAGAPAFANEGRQIAFVCISSVAVYDVYLAQLDGGSPRRLARFRGLPQGLAWRDAGHLLVANDSGDGTGVWTLDMEGKLQRPAATEDSLAPGLAAHSGRTVYSRARQVIDILHLSLTHPAGSARRWIYTTRAQLTP